MSAGGYTTEFKPLGPELFHDLQIKAVAQNPEMRGFFELLYNHELSPESLSLMANREKKLISPEQRATRRLQSDIGGRREVKTPTGYIDLLTDEEVIEVKQVSDWKSAIGQVLAYAKFYPERRKRVHLFGKANPRITDHVASLCEELGILLTFDKEGA